MEAKPVNLIVLSLRLAVRCALPGEDPSITRQRARAFLDYLLEGKDDA